MARHSPLPFAAVAAGLVALLSPQAVSAQDVAAGQRVFAQCRACHIIDNNGKNAVGPNLYGVTQRKAGSIESFRYSASMKEQAEAGLTWTDESKLRAYLANPKEIVPRGAMSFAGLKNEQQITDVIAFLKSNGG